MSLFKSIKIDTNNATGNAFGHVRVSMPHTLFDSKQIFNNAPLFWDDSETSGSGTGSTHSADTSSSILTVGATTAGVRVRQTFERFNYQPGKSQLVLMTGILDDSGGGTDIIRRIGYFDENNGLFFEDNAGTINVVRRTKVTGSPVDNAVAQSSWNVDKMDGTGKSGETVDFAKTQIFIIDFEWLGVGRVRLGVDIDGVTHYIHEFLHSNDLTEVYMSTPNLPVRYEISNGGTGVASSLKQLCTSVISEGGVGNNGIVRYASTNGVEVATVAQNTVYAIMGIRLKSAGIGATITLLNTSLQIQTATEKLEWILLWNPTSVAGTFTYVDETNSNVQIARGVGTTTVVGGTPIAGGFFESGNNSSGAGSLAETLTSALKLGSSISGTVDEIILAVRPVDGSTIVNVEGSLTWRELS